MVFGTFLKRISTFLDNFDVFSVNFVVFLVFIQPVLTMLANAVAWVGGEVGGEGALHMLCKVSLLPLLVSTFACSFFKLKRASRSHAKTGFFWCL